MPTIRTVRVESAPPETAATTAKVVIRPSFAP